MPSKHHDQDVSPTMCLNDSWHGASPPDQDHTDKVGLLPNNMPDRCTEWEISSHSSSWHGTPLPNPDLSHINRDRLPPNDSCHRCQEKDTSLLGPTHYQQQESLLSSGPQGSSNYDE